MEVSNWTKIMFWIKSNYIIGICNFDYSFHVFVRVTSLVFIWKLMVCIVFIFNIIWSNGSVLLSFSWFNDDQLVVWNKTSYNIRQMIGRIEVWDDIISWFLSENLNLLCVCHVKSYNTRFTMSNINIAWWTSSHL